MYQLEYVCRRCGAHFGNDALKYKSWELAEHVISNQSVTTSLFHRCDDREGMGFSDLVGFCRAEVLTDYDKEYVYAVAERDGILGSKSYKMHDGPTDLKNLMDYGISGSNNNYRILKMEKSGDNTTMVEIFRWDHHHGQWREIQ